MRKLKLVSLLFGLCLMTPMVVSAAEPALFFSDLASGPRIGLTDDNVSNQGVIVTIWGENLSSTQGNSKVYVGNPNGSKAEVAHVYYWCNADMVSGGGPADLYSRHGMQEIAFAISSQTPVGDQKIWVEVDGVSSSLLDFYVRPDNTSANRIFFVKTSGDDSNSGSWSSPWRTMSHATESNDVDEGDTVYMCDGLSTTEGLRVRTKYGSENMRIAYVVYPGATALVQGTSFGIGNHSGVNTYCVFSKFTVRGDTGGIDFFHYSRLVGNSITDISCANGATGGMGGASNQRGSLIYGNYIYEFGGDCTGNLEHPTYFTIRKNQFQPLDEIDAFDFGWNYLLNNPSRGGIHVYDEHGCGGYKGTVKIHDNVVEGQHGTSIGIGTGTCDEGYRLSGNFEVFNNIVINGGAGNFPDHSVTIRGIHNTTNVKFYNNLIYGHKGDGGTTEPYAFGIYNNNSNQRFGGTLEYKNNIVVDTENKKFAPDDGVTSAQVTVSGNNIWYNGGDGIPSYIPDWDNSPIVSDPLFINKNSFNFQLEQNSPAVDAGSNSVISVASKDLNGYQRPLGGIVDIGPYDYYDGSGQSGLLLLAPIDFRIVQTN